VQDGVRVTLVLFQFFDCFNRRQDQELDLAAPGFSLHFLHDRQSAVSGAEYEAPALPWCLLFERERCVAEGLAELAPRANAALQSARVSPEMVVSVCPSLRRFM
jgi:hypothetical protein